MLGALPLEFSPETSSSSQAVGAGLGDRINHRADFLSAEARSLSPLYGLLPQARTKSSSARNRTSCNPARRR